MNAKTPNTVVVRLREQPENKTETPRRRFFRRLMQHKGALILIGFVLLSIILSAIWPALGTKSPYDQDLANALAQPSGENWLGTDELGRDVFSRIVAASGVTLLASAFATGISLLIGLPAGLLAGFLRGKVDAVLNKINDSVMAIPNLILAMAVVASLGTGIMKTMIAVGIVTSPRFFRVARAMAISLREEQFIEAARSIGAKTRWIIFRHVLPNAVSALIVQISVTMGLTILIEASLSYLGLGIQPPDASWGSMLQKATQYTTTNPLLVLAPGFMIVISVLAFNTFGDAVRDSLGREIRKAD